MAAPNVGTASMTARGMTASRVTAGDVRTRAMRIRQIPTLQLRMRTIGVTAHQVRVDPVQVVQAKTAVAAGMRAGEKRASRMGAMKVRVVHAALLRSCMAARQMRIDLTLQLGMRADFV